MKSIFPCDPPPLLAAARAPKGPEWSRVKLGSGKKVV